MTASRPTTRFGILVADIGSPDDDPLVSVVLPFSNVVEGRHKFLFGRRLCLSNYSAADYGVDVQMRFGLLDGRGQFSGFGEWVTVEFPDLSSPEVPDTAATSTSDHAEDSGESATNGDGRGLNGVEDAPPTSEASCGIASAGPAQADLGLPWLLLLGLSLYQRRRKPSVSV